MQLREITLAALSERFGNEMGTGASDDRLAVFQASHPDVGDAVVWDADVESTFSLTIQVGQILEHVFQNFDSHLDEEERARRLAQDVVRFLAELRADRLLLWRSTDGRNRGWRERGDAGHMEPLVLDNRTYQRYVWSGPLPLWQAVPAIITRGHIRSDREYEIVATLLQEGGPDALSQVERDHVEGLAADWRRSRPVQD